MATPEFILELREKIGHDPLWLIGITAYVEDAGGRILLGRRADTGEWAPVYGIVDPGEEPAAAAAREVAEEAGIDVKPVALARVHAQKEPTVYPNGDQCQYLDLMFLCEPVGWESGEPRAADEENTDMGWFDPEELPEPLSESAAERMAAMITWKDQRDRGDCSALFSL